MNDYRYATARIKVLETRLITQNIIERILEAKTPEDAVKVLTETEYSSYFGEMDSVYDFEDVIIEHLKDVFKVVEDSTKNLNFTNIFRYKYDFHNLKVLIKANYTGDNPRDNIIPLGKVDIKKLTSAVAEKDFSELPSLLKEGATKSLEDFELNHNPQAIDTILDRFFYQKILAIAAELGEFAVEFVKTDIDLTNINIFLRYKKAGLVLSRLENVVIEGGYLEPSFYKEYYNEPLNNFAEALVVTRYEKIVDQGIQDWIDNKDSTQLEKVLDNYFMALAKQGNSAPFGIKPILGFLKAKESESELLRLLFVSKINDIPVKDIRERLRDTYV